MADMSIAHFGTTLIESPPIEGADQAAIPMTGDLARTDQFLKILGAEVYITNMLPGIGRQYIYRRGEFTDPDYFEKDTFTSYSAKSLPAISGPREGDIVFRLAHQQPTELARQLMEAGLIKPLSSYDDFIAEKTDRLFMKGPDQQHYELCQSSDQRCENHRVYIWTDASNIEAHKAGYAEHFDIAFDRSEDFYGMATVQLLVRQDPGITIGLLTPLAGNLAPKHSFDIFGDAGYSHFRLGAPDKTQVLNNSTEAFADGGGPVSYVHFQNAYLELVQIGTPSDTQSGIQT